MPSKLYHVDLSAQERLQLNGIISRHKSTSQMVKRSKILLASDRNGEKCWKDADISKQYEVSTKTIERLRKRFIEGGIDLCLKGKPRLNLDKKRFDGVVEAQLIALRCSEPQEGRSNWTLRLLADKMVALEYVDSISHESVRQILKKTKLSLGE